MISLIIFISKIIWFDENEAAFRNRTIVQTVRSIIISARESN